MVLSARRLTDCISRYLEAREGHRRSAGIFQMNALLALGLAMVHWWFNGPASMYSL